MKIHRRVSYLFLFSSFLVAGFWAGKTTIHSGFLFPSNTAPRPAISAAHVQARSSPAENGQQNFLVISVDDLKAPQPGLESVWLVLYVNNLPHLTLLPVFPTLTKGQLTLHSLMLADTFKLDSERAPVPEFFASLEERDLLWNGYVLLDQKALKELVKRARGQGALIGGEQIQEIPSVWENPAGALDGQFRLAQELCRLSPHFTNTNDLPRLLRSLRSHITTDLDLNHIGDKGDFSSIHQEGFICEFPTFNLLTFR